MKYIKSFWRFILLGPTLLGLYYFPVDFSGWSEASEPWKRLVSLFTREQILFGFLLVVSIWLLWSDTRPYRDRWIESRKKAKQISDGTKNETSETQLAKKELCQFSKDILLPTYNKLLESEKCLVGPIIAPSAGVSFDRDINQDWIDLNNDRTKKMRESLVYSNFREDGFFILSDMDELRRISFHEAQNVANTCLQIMYETYNNLVQNFKFLLGRDGNANASYAAKAVRDAQDALERFEKSLGQLLKNVSFNNIDYRKHSKVGSYDPLTKMLEMAESGKAQPVRYLSYHERH